MANTSAVYVRIDPTLKKDVEEILSTLGVTPSALIQMLYSQIKLTKSVPFEIKVPSRKPLILEDMTRQQLDLELAKGYKDIQDGHVYSSDEVDKMLKNEFGI